MEASAEANINSYVQRAIEAADDTTLADSLESLHNEIYSRTTKEDEEDINLWSVPEADLLYQKFSDEIDTKRPIFLHKTQLDAGLLEAGMHPEAVIEEMDKAISSGKPLPDKPDLKSEDWRAIKQRAEQTLQERNVIIKLKSEQTESDLSARMAALDFSKVQENQQEIVQQIRLDIQTAQSEGFLDGTQVRELTHFLDSRITNAGKKATEIQMLEATDAIQSAIEKGDREGAKKLLWEHAWMFTPSKNDQMLQDIRGRDQKSTDTMLTDALAAETDVANAEVQALKDKTPEQIAQASVNSMRRREEMRKEWRTKPDMTPNDKLKFTENLLKPAKEEAAKKAVKLFIWNAFGKMHNWGVPSKKQENPYAKEYPNAFLEDGVWKVIKDGKKYRIEP